MGFANAPYINSIDISKELTMVSMDYGECRCINRVGDGKYTAAPALSVSIHFEKFSIGAEVCTYTFDFKNGFTVDIGNDKKYLIGELLQKIRESFDERNKNKVACSIQILFIRDVAERMERMYKLRHEWERDPTSIINAIVDGIEDVIITKAEEIFGNCGYPVYILGL